MKEKCGRLITPCHHGVLNVDVGTDFVAVIPL